MSNSKAAKTPTNAQTPANVTRASANAASKLASFANASVSHSSTTSGKETSPDETTASNVAFISTDQLSTEFEKQRASLKDDISSLILESTKSLQTSLDTLQATVNTFQTRLTSVETVAGDNFTRLTTAESTIETLQTQNLELLDRIDDLENRSRRANLRIINIPEGSEDGKDVVKFVAEMLVQVLGPEVFTTPPELERAHRSPTFRSPESGRRKSPRTFLVCFSKFQQKEAALNWARNHELKFQGTVIRIYQDLSATLAKKRAAFNKIKEALYKKNVRFHQLYPARLRIMYKGDPHTFDSPEKAQEFYDRRICKE